MNSSVTEVAKIGKTVKRLADRLPSSGIRKNAQSVWTRQQTIAGG
jgi:hypothetical protein